MSTPEVSARAKRFVSALEDLLKTGMGWEWEIEREVTALGSEAVADFVQKASRACGTLGDMAANILLDAEVRLPAKDAARKAARRRAA